MIDAVLFDVDGTLVDHDAARAAALTAQLCSTCPGLTSAEIYDAHELWAGLERQHFADYLVGRVSFGEQRRRRVAGLLNAINHGAENTVEYDRWFDGYLEAYERAWTGYHDVIETLERLGKRQPTLILGVLSNGEQTQQRAKLTATHLAGHFSVVLTSSELGSAKPDARIFVAACAHINRAPHTVAYVGNDVDADARAATAAGLHGIWLDRSTGNRTVYSPRIRSLRSLEPLLR